MRPQGQGPAHQPPAHQTPTHQPTTHQPTTHQPSAHRRLERRYRRLLALYPAQHRLAYADEMLGVLMAGAREGQRRPRLGESVNLVVTAARLRLARGAEPTDHWWLDAAAVLAVLAPILMLARAIRPVTAGLGAALLTPTQIALFTTTTWIRIAAWLLATVIVLCGPRWPAAGVAWGAGALGGLLLVPPVVLVTQVSVPLMVTAVALSLPGGGPRRGLALLGWRRVAWLLGAGAVIAFAPTVVGLLGAPNRPDAGPVMVEGWHVAAAAMLTYVVAPVLVVFGAAGLTPTVRRRLFALAAPPLVLFTVGDSPADPGFVGPVHVRSPLLPTLLSWPVLLLAVSTTVLAGTLLIRRRERG